MSRWNTLSSTEALAEWKSFRKNLNGNTALEDVATHFFDVPLGARCVDYYTPENWLSPWEILSFKAYCRSNVTLLMYYSIVLSELPGYAAEVALIDDFADIFLVLIINKKHVLNFELGKVTDLCEVMADVKIIEIFDSKRIKYYE